MLNLNAYPGYFENVNYYVFDVIILLLLMDKYIITVML